MARINTTKQSVAACIAFVKHSYFRELTHGQSRLFDGMSADATVNLRGRVIKSHERFVIVDVHYVVKCKGDIDARGTYRIARVKNLFAEISHLQDQLW